MSILFRTKGWLTIAQLARAWTAEIPGAERDPQQFEQELVHLLLEDIVNRRLDDAGPLAEGRRLGLRNHHSRPPRRLPRWRPGPGSPPSRRRMDPSFRSDRGSEGGRARFRAPTCAATSVMVERCCCCLNQARRPFAARYRYSNTKRCFKEPGQFKAAARRQTSEARAGEGGYEERHSARSAYRGGIEQHAGKGPGRRIRRLPRYRPQGTQCRVGVCREFHSRQIATIDK